MSLVLDASLALAWLLPDETAVEIQQVFEQIGVTGCVVPQIWRLEVANGLTTAVRRGRITAVFRAQAIKVLELTPIRIDSDTNTHAWAGTLQLADRFELTPYDACYLEVAHRLALPLATLDRGLRAAAAGLGVTTLGV
ncbi:MAG TPA: type II toxin-antitoxin system VapC family toxin [Stellaceae bacterium]|nr:type II toxin-antitoxin system VapC family toxin [Stellaceae bacterium]